MEKRRLVQINPQPNPPSPEGAAVERDLVAMLMSDRKFRKPFKRRLQSRAPAVAAPTEWVLPSCFQPTARWLSTTLKLPFQRCSRPTG